MNFSKKILSSQQLLVTALGLFVLTLGSCAKNKGATGSNGPYDPNNPYGDGSDPYGNPNGGGFVEDIPLNGRPEGGVNFYGSNVNRGLYSPIFFGFDSYEISGAELQKIQQVAQYMRSNPAKVIIAGHTDEVGTSEYNRNLGDRRATAVRTALAQQGVDPARVHTVSYGEDMLAQPGPSESANSANRRSEFGFYQ
ncbi:MAG: peptidoglycan-associated lipoprotein [Verrucomicrobiales bacterium]|jgi:peptidoglycan-associated lipoprotein